jgi:hypothetical protein
MNQKLVLLFIAALVTPFTGPSSSAWAGAGGEGDAPCVVSNNGVLDPPGIKLTGTLAVSAEVASGSADVILRLERTDEAHFFRAQYQTTPPFTAPTLLAAQTRLCEILRIEGLASGIIGAFHLQGSTLVTSTKGIRNTQVIPTVDAGCSLNQNALECRVPGLQFESDPEKYLNPGNPSRGIFISDVVLFVQ